MHGAKKVFIVPSPVGAIRLTLQVANVNARVNVSNLCGESVTFGHASAGLVANGARDVARDAVGARHGVEGAAVAPQATRRVRAVGEACASRRFPAEFVARFRVRDRFEAVYLYAVALAHDEAAADVGGRDHLEGEKQQCQQADH